MGKMFILVVFFPHYLLNLHVYRNNLKIMGLLTTDSGLFQCFASNPAGNIQAVANLRVTGNVKFYNIFIISSVLFIIFG